MLHIYMHAYTCTQSRYLLFVFCCSSSVRNAIAVAFVVVDTDGGYLILRNETLRVLLLLCVCVRARLGRRVRLAAATAAAVVDKTGGTASFIRRLSKTYRNICVT